MELNSETILKIAQESTRVDKITQKLKVIDKNNLSEQSIKEILTDKEFELFLSYQNTIFGKLIEN